MAEPVKIDMQPHSGVVAFDTFERAFPVVGWFSQELDNGGMKLLPLVLQHGELLPLDDPKVQYAIVGLTERWFRLVQQHNGG